MKQTAEEQIKELKQQLAMANEKIAQLTAIIKLQKNQIFWKKTEVMEPVVDGQQSLFSEQEMDQLQDPDISVTEVTEKNKASGASPESKTIWSADHFFRWFTTG